MIFAGVNVTNQKNEILSKFANKKIRIGKPSVKKIKANNNGTIAIKFSEPMYYPNSTDNVPYCKLLKLTVKQMGWFPKGNDNV